MSMAVVDDVGVALDVTRTYLRRRSIRGYLRLALVALFLGPPGLFGPPGPVELRRARFGLGGRDFPSRSALLDAVGGEPVLIGLLVGLVATALGYALVGAICEFALVRLLVADTVSVRDPARRYRRSALELFLFRLVVGTATIAGLSSVLLALWGVDVAPVDSAGALVLLAVVGILGYVVHRFTTDFVVAIVFAEGRSLLGGWRRLLRIGRERPRIIGLYAPVRIALEVAGGVAFGVALSLSWIALALVVGLPIFAVFALVGGTAIAAGVTAAVLVPMTIGLVGAVIAPFQVYYRSYALLVLGDADESLDLVADWRSRVATDADLVGRL